MDPLPLDPEDPLADPPERAQLRAVLREVLAAHHPPERARQLDDTGAFDEELYRSLAQVGVTGLGADPEDGGSGDVREQVAAIETVAGPATSMAVFLIVHFMALHLLGAHGSDAQRREVLAALVAGEAKAAFALTEPDGGTDVARAMRTRALRVGDSWTLHGRKLWISGADQADHLIVLARTSPSADGASIDGISTFLVPGDAAGLSVTELDTVAVHGLATCEVTLDGVVVPDGALLGEEGRGFRQVLGTLNRERLNAAAGALGAGAAALGAARDYAAQRQAFGRPIGGFQALQHRLVDGAIALEAARGLVLRAAMIEAAGGDATTLTSMAKIAASEAAVQVTQDGMQVMGGAGFSRDFPMQRWFRDVRLWTFSPLSNEVLRNQLGEGLLDLPRSF